MRTVFAALALISGVAIGLLLTQLLGYGLFGSAQHGGGAIAAAAAGLGGGVGLALALRATNKK